MNIILNFIVIALSTDLFPAFLCCTLKHFSAYATVTLKSWEGAYRRARQVNMYFQLRIALTCTVEMFLLKIANTVKLQQYTIVAVHVHKLCKSIKRGLSEIYATLLISEPNRQSI